MVLYNGHKNGSSSLTGVLTFRIAGAYKPDALSAAEATTTMQ